MEQNGVVNERLQGRPDTKLFDGLLLAYVVAIAVTSFYILFALK
jgi:hypothetical protein